MVAKKKYSLDILNKVVPSIDSKDYLMYDNLSDVERKAFAAVVVMRWGANLAISDAELQGFYIRSINYHANKHFFSMYKHPKLQWLMIVASSPKIGHYKRKWVGKKKTPSKARDQRKKILRDIHPTYKEDEIDMLSDMVTKRELTQYAKDCGER
jgi:hypothetical protein